jgi:hypothetical protein
MVSMRAILALTLGRLTQEDCKFKVSLGYKVIPYPKKIKERKKSKIHLYCGKTQRRKLL